ncbi:hypothetical protein L873DRAFT_1800126 [Choiromyces venosus 120613-1]|uniref:Uncharacterized protein n=1 Tax=Choiromyces venosus 120613-1 TaxID=1336337 RepID=A0A3N4K373_9PEZI|nr:hypothetical protein L873DRAFT_1800126 [Choiromyces venosus 120613-1]
MLDTLPENTSVDSGIGSDGGRSGSSRSAKSQPEGREDESGAIPSPLNVGTVGADVRGKQKKIMSAPPISTLESQLQKEPKPLTRGSKSVGGSVGDPAVLISAATSEEVQVHSGFNSWLSGFWSTPVTEAKEKSDFSANLAKLRAQKGDKEVVLAQEANGADGWAQQVVPEPIQKMLRADVSDGEVHVIVKGLVKPSAKDKEIYVEETLISSGSTIFDLCEKISSKGIKKEVFLCC